jgi:hypothetical protein
VQGIEMPKAMIMKFSLPSFKFPFIRLVKGSVFYKLNLSFRPTVLSYIVILVFILSKLAMAGEFENQIEEIQSNTGAASETTKKILKKESRIVPVPIPISNPTLGVGLAGAILYMHPKSDSEKDAPTSITGAFGMYTDTKSWAVGGFHDGYYLDDRIRFRVPVTHGEFNLNYYGTGENSPFRDNPIKYSAIGNLFVPRISFELPLNKWYLGGQYRLIDIATNFDNLELDIDTPGLDQRLQTAGFGLVSIFDSRDSNLWPSRGNWLDITATLNGAYAGGDYEYLKSAVKWAQYFPLKDSLVVVYRLDGQFVNGEAPFWDLSRIRLRGFSSGQYLDNVALTAQAELRWNLYRRWTLLAFGGGGRIADAISEVGRADNNLAGGGGFRYMVIEKTKLALGIDVAYSDASDIAIYFQVGDWLAN